MNNFLARLLLPFAIWFAHFSISYGATTLLCSTGQGTGVHRTVMVLATVLAVILLIVTLATSVRVLKSRSDRIAAAVATGLAQVAVVWTSLPAILLDACS